MFHGGVLILCVGREQQACLRASALLAGLYPPEGVSGARES